MIANSAEAREYHDNHILGTGIYGGAYPNWQEVRLNFHRAGMMSVCDARARDLIDGLGFTVKDTVLIVGAGFGWLAECLKIRLPGIMTVCTDISPWIHFAKNETETAEIDAAVRAAGILPGTEAYDAAMTALDDGGTRARETVENVDILDTVARKGLLNKYGPFTWAITEQVLPWLTDTEAVALDDAMHAVIPNRVAHLTSLFMDDFENEPPEPNPWNWKHLTGKASTRSDLETLSWYGATSWKSLLPRSTIVGVGGSGVA